MRTLFIICLLGLFNAPLSAQQNDTATREIDQVVQQLFLAIDQPSPTHHTKTREWRGYQIQLNEYAGSELYKDQGLFYSLTYFDFPEEVAEGKSPKELLNIFLQKKQGEESIAQLPGVLQATETFRQNGLTIRDYHAAIPQDNRSADIRAIVDGRRLYMLQILSPQVEPHPSVETFYDGFELIE